MFACDKPHAQRELKVGQACFSNDATVCWPDLPIQGLMRVCFNACISFCKLLVLCGLSLMLCLRANEYEIPVYIVCYIESSPSYTYMYCNNKNLNILVTHWHSTLLESSQISPTLFWPQTVWQSAIRDTLQSDCSLQVLNLLLEEGTVIKWCVIWLMYTPSGPWSKAQRSFRDIITQELSYGIEGDMHLDMYCKLQLRISMIVKVECSDCIWCDWQVRQSFIKVLNLNSVIIMIEAVWWFIRSRLIWW